MKNLLATIFILTLALSLVGCSNKDDASTNLSNAGTSQVDADKDNAESNKDNKDSDKTNNTSDNIKNDVDEGANDTEKDTEANESDEDKNTNDAVTTQTDTEYPSIRIDDDKHTETSTNNSDKGLGIAPEMIERFGEDHIVLVDGDQYYVDNVMEVVLLEDSYTIDDCISDYGKYGEIKPADEASCSAYLYLNRNYSFNEICRLQDEINQSNDNILILVINIMDNSSWYSSDIPMN